MTACCLVVLAGVLAGPVAGASASEASIKATFEHYKARVDVAEGHVVSALGEYETSKEPAKAETALKEAASVLLSLRSKIQSQSASAPRVKEAKTKIVEGLGGVAAAYKDLANALEEKTSSPEAAKAEAQKFKASAKKAILELHEGVKLLG